MGNFNYIPLIEYMERKYINPDKAEKGSEKWGNSRKKNRVQKIYLFKLKKV